MFTISLSVTRATGGIDPEGVDGTAGVAGIGVVVSRPLGGRTASSRFHM
jgi:hypothetical protein